MTQRGTRPPVHPAGSQRNGPRLRLPRGWLNSTVFTAALTLLVAAGVAERGVLFPLALVLAAVAGSGLLYLMFPRGLHFAFGTANGLAVYACLYSYVSRAGFPGAGQAVEAVGFLLPVAAFLLAVWRDREALRRPAEASVPDEAGLFSGMARWMLALTGIGAVSLALPIEDLSRLQQSAALLLAMLATAAVVFGAAAGTVRLLVDVSLIFESLGARARRIGVPIVAYLAIFALLTITFASIYRVADALSPAPLFTSTVQPPAGVAYRINYADALYLSVCTLTTVGYGDIVPQDTGLRVIASIEMVLGQLMLLFGFAEVTRNLQQHRQGSPVDEEVRRASGTAPHELPSRRRQPGTVPPQSSGKTPSP